MLQLMLQLRVSSPTSKTARQVARQGAAGLAIRTRRPYEPGNDTHKHTHTHTHKHACAQSCDSHTGDAFKNQVTTSTQAHALSLAHTHTLTHTRPLSRTHSHTHARTHSGHGAGIDCRQQGARNSCAHRERRAAPTADRGCRARGKAVASCPRCRAVCGALRLRHCLSVCLSVCLFRELPPLWSVVRSIHLGSCKSDATATQRRRSPGAHGAPFAGRNSSKPRKGQATRWRCWCSR